jgi:predicted permease
MSMIKKYDHWYKSLSPFKQIMVSFIINWLYWFIIWLLGEMLFFDEKRSWLYHIFHATWMATFMTNLFKWKQTKSLFKRKDEQKA